MINRIIAVTANFFFHKIPGQIKNLLNDSHNSPLLRLTVVFAGGNFVSLVIFMAGGLLVARFADPADFGLFNSIGLILGYLVFLQAGVASALNRQYPYLIGRGQDEDALGYAATAQAWALLLGGLSAAGLWIIAFWHAYHLEWQLAAGFLVFGFSAFCMFYVTQYLQPTYRTHGDFAQLTRINVTKNIIALATTIFVWMWGFFGLCLRSFIDDLLNLTMHWIRRPILVRPAWSWRRWTELIRIGVPLFAAGQLYSWWIVLNSTMVLSYLGTRSLGLYQIALVTGSALEILYSSLGQIIYPQMSEDYGRHHQVGRLLALALRPTGWMFLASIVLVAVGWWLLPSTVRLVLPKYVEAVPAAQWTLAASAVLVFQPLLNIFGAIRRMKFYIISLVCGMVVYYLSLQWMLAQERDLTVFPKAMLAGRVVMLVLSYVFIAWLNSRPVIVKSEV